MSNVEEVAIESRARYSKSAMENNGVGAREAKHLKPPSKHTKQPSPNAYLHCGLSRLRAEWSQVFVGLTPGEGQAIKVKYTTDYMAGVVAGFGIACFGLFLLAKGAGILSGYRLAAGLLGLVLIVFSIGWKLRIQNGK